MKFFDQLPASACCLLWMTSFVFTIPYFYVLAVHSDREPGNIF